MSEQREIPRIDIIGQNGNDGEHYSAAASYINQQTARKLIEDVARALEKEAQQEATLGRMMAATRSHLNAEKLRDALALMVGCG